MAPIIRLRALTYAYRRQAGRPALQGVDLDINRGEFVAVAGRAGSGKSTLCYALNGLVPHSFGGQFSGMAEVCGLDTARASVPELARRVGLVLQSAESQLVGLTVEEDTAFGLENIGLPIDEVARRVSAALARVRLGHHAQASPWRLSGGQKQRMAIAAALAFEPEVLVLDNPTAELDPVGKAEVMATLAALNRERGTTIVIVNQELEEVLPCASRLLLMAEGRIAHDGTPAEIIDRPEAVSGVGVRLPGVVHVASLLRERGVWSGPLPLDVTRAAAKLAPLTAHTGAHLYAGADGVRAEAGSEALIDVERASFSYPGGPPVLKDVSLTIRRGEFLALMGPNGTGKTTLAKHFNGLLQPTAGRVLVHGLDTRTAGVAQLARRVGYVFQNPDHQLFSRTVAEECAFGPKNLGWSRERVDAAVSTALGHLGEGGRGHDDPFFMGIAERKLVAIASVMAMAPEVLVLDEPATGADHEAALRIMNYLASLNRAGLTVIIVTHDVSLAATYASRIVVSRDGGVALDGTPDQVFAQTEALRDCLVTPPQAAQLATALGTSPFTCRTDRLVARLSGADR